jgi:ATP-dependent RNA helicase DDX52/ROK1
MDAVIEAAHSTTEIRGLASARLVFGMFTATVSTGIEELANSVLNDPLRVFVGARGAAASSIKQSLLFVGKEEGKIIALRNMVASGVQTPALVFVQSKDRGEDVKNALADQVGAEGAGVLHGDLSPSERNSVVQRVRRGTVLFLVATDLAARGLDFPGVKTVINFDFPTTGVQYIHRIGRTGRGGRSGEAVTFFVENDIRLLRTIANVMRISGCDVPEWMLTLKKLERKAQKRLKTRAVKRSSFNGSLHGSER